MAPQHTLALSFFASASLLASVAVAQPAARGERTFTTTLTGEAEVPGPGDEDGTGSATVTVSVPDREICYEITVSDIDAVTAAHIHDAPAGVAGGVFVGLEFPSGCVDVTASQAALILARPAQFYVNVHNADFPGGALRGQLG
jgi:hypothetical protein